jgi:diacylglycerol kinase (ATP)
VSADRPRVRVLVNPVSGRGKAKRNLARLRALLKPQQVEIQVPADVEELRELCRRAVADGIDRLGIAGGDGTLHHAIQPLSGTPCALGILPVGSCNDLAAALGIGSDLERAVRNLLHGGVRRIDLGSVGDRLYAGIGGIGFDGEVARMVNEEVRWLPGPVAFPYAAVRTLFRFRPPGITIDHDGGRFQGSVYFAVLANSPRFGGGMRIAPDASMEDGLLDLVIVHRVPRRTLLRCLPSVYSGRHTGHPAVELLRTREAVVSCDRTMTVYGDGEPMLPLGSEPLRFRVVPGALGVIA